MNQIDQIARIGLYLCGGGLAVIGLAVLAVKVLSVSYQVISEPSGSQPGKLPSPFLGNSGAFFLDPVARVDQVKGVLVWTRASEPIDNRGRALTRYCCDIHEAEFLARFENR